SRRPRPARLRGAAGSRSSRAAAGRARCPGPAAGDAACSADDAARRSSRTAGPADDRPGAAGRPLTRLRRSSIRPHRTGRPRRMSGASSHPAARVRGADARIRYGGGMGTSQRRVGASGLVVSATGLGCNNFGRAGRVTETLEGTRAVIDAALANGVFFFDTADMYGAVSGRSEELMGEVLQGRRDRVVLATKFGHDHDMGYDFPGGRGSRRYVRLAVEHSLRRLRTDWIDLYQLHLPDPQTPIAETIDALDELVREGKIRYYGHSNLDGWQIAEAEFTARIRSTGRFISAQNHYSLLARAAEREVLPAVNRYQLGFFPFFPLKNGLLTGKFTREGGPEGSRIMDTRRHI